MLKVGDTDYILKTPDIALVSINNYPDKISPAAFCYGPLPSMGEKLFAV